MRLVKLSLLLLACCMFAQAQTAPAQSETSTVVPSHSPNDLMSRLGGWKSPFPVLRPNAKNLPSIDTTKRFRVDPDMALNSRTAVDSNTCFKLRKYVFQPKAQNEKNGMRPLGDEMQFAGETDCTYANKVWPKSADGAAPPRPQFGLQSAVAHQK